MRHYISCAMLCSAESSAALGEGAILISYHMHFISCHISKYSISGENQKTQRISDNC
jgi:hypothetical protein